MRQRVRCVRVQPWASNEVFLRCFRELDPFRPIGGWGEMGAIDPRLIEWWIDREQRNGRRLTPRQIREIPRFVPQMDLAWRSWKQQQASSKVRKREEEPEDD